MNIHQNNANNQVLLITCPRLWPRLPPLGLASLKAFLVTHGVSCGTLDLNNFFYNCMTPDIKKLWEIPVFPAMSAKLWDYINLNYNDELKKVTEIIAGNPADYLGFSIWHSNKNFSLNFIRHLKRFAPDKKVIIGGPEITLSYNVKKNEDFLKNFSADHIIVGEGESSLLNIVTKTETRNVNIFNYNELENLDKIPKPDFNQIIAPSYRYAKAYPVWMARGCVRKCAFCVEHTLYRKFRSKNPVTVARELEDYYDNEQIGHFIFFDSLINGNLNLFEKFLDELIKIGKPIKWEAQVLIRTDMPDKLFHKMKQSGCYNMFVGLESGSDAVLKLMGKGFTTKDAVSFFKKSRSAGLHFEVSMISGFPGETDKNFKETKRFIETNANLIPKIAQINPYMDLPGSPLNKSGTDTNVLDLADIKKRIDKLVKIFDDNHIKYTSSYINNLTALEADFNEGL